MYAYVFVNNVFEYVCVRYAYGWCHGVIDYDLELPTRSSTPYVGTYSIVLNFCSYFLFE